MLCAFVYVCTSPALPLSNLSPPFFIMPLSLSYLLSSSLSLCHLSLIPSSLPSLLSLSPLCPFHSPPPHSRSPLLSTPPPTPLLSLHKWYFMLVIYGDFSRACANLAPSEGVTPVWRRLPRVQPAPSQRPAESENSACSRISLVGKLRFSFTL